MWPQLEWRQIHLFVMEYSSSSCVEDELLLAGTRAHARVESGQEAQAESTREIAFDGGGIAVQSQSRGRVLLRTLDTCFLKKSLVHAADLCDFWSVLWPRNL